MAERGYIVFSLDNRGSLGRGKAWEEPLLKQMGKVELEDQLIGVDYLKSLAYVDPERIGVWGWSYGGYMTLLSLFNAPETFRAGVSVAPVTDWRLYDSIYTERYMKLPKDNQAGYEASAPVTHADDLADPLLLMHGDADDNVHMQNSIVLMKQLIAAGKDFDFMLYPQKKHGISGSAERLHLYRKMTAFFDRNLRGAPPQESPVP
jgi:dipeptidyl-peptidase-4